MKRAQLKMKNESRQSILALVSMPACGFLRKKKESITTMKENSGEKPYRPKLWQNPGYVLYSWWAELYTRWQENFNPKWREPLPRIPCQLCGRTGHTESFCPKARELGFLPGKNEE
jgi:hypothetical protein